MIVAARFVRVNGLSSSTNQRNQTGQGSDRRVDAKRQMIPVTKNSPTIPKRMLNFLLMSRLGEHTRLGCGVRRHARRRYAAALRAAPRRTLSGVRTSYRAIVPQLPDKTPVLSTCSFVKHCDHDFRL